MVGNGDSNGSYTPPIYGDPRAMSQSPDKMGVVFMTMPQTRPDAITSQVELRGDIKAAGQYVPLVTQQMAAMHQQNVNGLEIVDRPVNLGGGNRMLCQRRFNADRALIEVPVKGGQKGPFWLNFDAETQKDFQSSFVDKIFGFGLAYNTDPNYVVPSIMTLSGKPGVGLSSDNIDPNLSDTSWSASRLGHSVDVQLKNSMQSSAYAVVTLGAYWAGQYSGENAGGSYFMADYNYGPVMPSIYCHLGTGNFDPSTSSYRTKFQAFWEGGAIISGFTDDRYKKFILCDKGKVIQLGPVYDPGDGYGDRQLVTSLHRMYLDGNLVNEYTEESFSYSMFDNEDATLIGQHGAYGVGESVLHQNIFTHTYHSEDETKRITDKLAAKWGF